MEVTLNQLAAMAGSAPNDNMKSVHLSLTSYGATHGLDRPHRLAQFLAQLLHESGNFRYDRELWGNTKAQLRYDTRTDLGNTPEQDGDGKKNAGRGPIQVTGAYNIGKYFDWCKLQGFNPPNFKANPDLINTDPWEGLSAIWYWAVGNPTGKSLNRYADEGDIEQITKKVNGGLNGFADRLEKYTKAGLVLLGYGATEVERFQKWAQKQGYLPKDEEGGPSQVDGDPGPKTRSAIHLALVGMDGRRSEASPEVKAAPVVQEVTVEVTKEVAVTPPAATKGSRVSAWLSGAAGFVTANLGSFFTQDLTTKLVILGFSGSAIVFVLWQGDVIVRQIKKISEQIG